GAEPRLLLDELEDPVLAGSGAAVGSGGGELSRAGFRFGLLRLGGVCRLVPFAARSGASWVFLLFHLGGVPSFRAHSRGKSSRRGSSERFTAKAPRVPSSALTLVPPEKCDGPSALLH